MNIAQLQMHFEQWAAQQSPPMHLMPSDEGAWRYVSFRTQVAWVKFAISNAAKHCAAQ